MGFQQKRKTPQQKQKAAQQKQKTVKKTQKPLQPRAPSFSFRSTGVRQSASGKWEVQICHKGKFRHAGTFKTHDSAALANRIMREALLTNAAKDTEPPSPN